MADHSKLNISGGMKTVRQYYRVDRRKINMVKFIFEAYEGVGAVTTLNPAAGWIVIATAPGCEAIIQEVMADMGKKFIVEVSGMPTDELNHHNI